VLGTMHPDTLLSICALACYYGTRGMHESAEPLLRRALHGTEDLLGTDHPDSRIMAENHSRCLAKLERPRSLRTLTAWLRRRMMRPAARQ